MKLLDFLADHVDFDYTISQLEGFAGISRPTLYELIRELEGEGMVIMTREVGNSRFYRLNSEEPKVAWMLQQDFEAINKKLMKQFEEPSRPSSSRAVNIPSRKSRHVSSLMMRGSRTLAMTAKRGKKK